MNGLLCSHITTKSYNRSSQTLETEVYPICCIYNGLVIILKAALISVGLPACSGPDRVLGALLSCSTSGLRAAGDLPSFMTGLLACDQDPDRIQQVTGGDSRPGSSTRSMIARSFVRHPSEQILCGRGRRPSRSTGSVALARGSRSVMS
jgi:hypothetical protein